MCVCVCVCVYVCVCVCGLCVCVRGWGIECYLNTQGLDVVGSICSAGEVPEVELDLVPAVVKAHGHGANKGLDPSSRLVVACTEPATYILVVQYLQ